MKTITIELTWEEVIDASSAVAFAAHIMEVDATPLQKTIMQRLHGIEKKLDIAAEANQPPPDEHEVLCAKSVEALIDALKQAGVNEH